MNAREVDVAVAGDAAREQRVGGDRRHPVADLVTRRSAPRGPRARAAPATPDPTRDGRCRRRRRPRSASNGAARSSACSSVETTARSETYIGCSGSIASTTPAAARGAPARRARRRPVSARRRDRGIRPAALPRRARASAIAELGGLLDCPSVVVDRRCGGRRPRGIVKNPPRHRLETRSPASRTSAAARAMPYSCTGSRQSPIAGMPASAVRRTAVSSAAVLDRRLVEREPREAHPRIPFRPSRACQRDAASSGRSSARASMREPHDLAQVREAARRRAARPPS